MTTRLARSCPSGNRAGLRLHLFGCGNGDTVILQFSCGSTVLIDCCLTKSTGSVARFEDFLGRQGITHFDIVVLTHPDEDHFRGMGDVLRKYKRDDGGTTFIDGGVSAKELVEYYQNRAGRSSFLKLQDAIEDLESKAQIVREETGENCNPISIDGGSAQLIPVGPSARERRCYLKHTAIALGSGRRPSFKTNAHSVSAVLSLGELPGQSLLFTGDIETDGLDAALDVWLGIAEERGLTKEFVVVKVPHHGSSTSYCKKLFQMDDRRWETRIAGVSAGSAIDVIPDREVIAGYLERGWTVLVTNPRVEPSGERPSFAFEIAGQHEKANPNSDMTVSIVIEAGCEPIWQPEECCILERDLNRFKSTAD